MNAKLEQEAQRVLAVVCRARNVFGGNTEPKQPPVFASARDLEDNLGRGHF